MEKVKPPSFGFEHIRPRYEFTDKDFRPVAEADVLLINGKYLMVIEVKTVLKVKDVGDHVKRLETIRLHACAPYGSRSFLGAVAGAVVDVAVKKYAHRKGLYVAEKSVPPAKQAAWEERLAWEGKPPPNRMGTKVSTVWRHAAPGRSGRLYPISVVGRKALAASLC